MQKLKLNSRPILWIANVKKYFKFQQFQVPVKKANKSRYRDASRRLRNAALRYMMSDKIVNYLELKKSRHQLKKANRLNQKFVTSIDLLFWDRNYK